MRTIRASEIGAYIYCQRAWWYRQQGYQPTNEVDFAKGRELHHLHARSIFISGCLRILAYALLISGIVLLAIHLTNQLLSL